MLLLGFGTVYGFCEYTSELRISDTKFMLEADVKRRISGLVGSGEQLYIAGSYISVRVAKFPPGERCTLSCNGSADVAWLGSEIRSSFNDLKHS